MQYIMNSAEVRRPRSEEGAEVRRQSIRHSAGVRTEAQEKVRMYAGVLWVKLQTFHEIYLAAPVYYCRVLGFEVMSGYWYYVLITIF